MPYTIIIPVHNEAISLPALLNDLEPYSKNNEILIVDDGSNDTSDEILGKCPFINLIILERNFGKGIAIQTGIRVAKYNKIVITDGDLELDPSELNKLMILNKRNGAKCIFGTRYEHINPFESLWELGNFFFTVLFNFIHGSQVPDALCCAKAFYKNDVNFNENSSKGFDIDVELAAMFVKKIPTIKIIYLSYNRRKSSQGKKLRLKDGWVILKRIIKY